MATSVKIKLSEFWQIFRRNVFLLTNGIIFSVVVLLFIFGQFKAGLFLGIISVANVFFGLFQDINAWRALAKLQLLTAPRVLRINNDGSETSVLTEEIKKDDIIKLKTGDQIPCDSIVTEALGLEINEGLLTGESSSILRQIGDRLLAGSIVTSGSGQIRTETLYTESRIARMTEGIKKYSLNSSPIQQSVNLVVRYAGYVLIASIIYVIVRGFLVAEPIVNIVLNVGTLSSMLVPQGLIFAITLFFAYGSANLFKKNVLLQEINATEKLGRIKNLCMDKTGTLTENTLSVDAIHLPTAVDNQEAENFTASYIQGTNDNSETIRAIKEFLKTPVPISAIQVQSFSSWRQYGAVLAKNKQGSIGIFVGAPDIFLPQVKNSEEKLWLTKLIEENAKQGKRVLCVAKSHLEALPKDLTVVSLSVVGVFVFKNDIREGISETVNFFQDRGVCIRILSGDNPHTVSSVASQAGVKNSNLVITGKEMESWTAEDYEKNVKSFIIFARILPEQKEKIIESLKKDGFAAMIGDGANDALAIKKADLGIAMFDGAPATRQLAAIVLVNNSFTALPGGVKLADDIISNIEIFSSLVFNQTFIGLFLFIFISVFGYEYPLTPFNVTLINYFAVGMPGLLISYWTIRPSKKVRPVSEGPFLKRVLPFAVSSAVVLALGVVTIFGFNAKYLKVIPPNTIILLSFIVLSFVFFAFTPVVYFGFLSRTKKIQIFVLALFEIILLTGIFYVPIVLEFFNAVALRLPFINVLEILLIITLVCFVQYLITRRFKVKPNLL